MIRLHNAGQIAPFVRLNLCQRVTKPLVAHMPQQRNLAADPRAVARCLKSSNLRVNYAGRFAGHGSQPPPRVRDHL